MERTRFSLHAADYAVCCLTTAIPLGIGLYHALRGGRQKSTLKYLLADRTMGVFPVSLSYVVTYMSSISPLVILAMVYVYGLPNLMSDLCIIVSNILAAWITVPLLHPLRINSCYQYLLVRFKSNAAQKVGSLMGMVKNTLYLVVVLYGHAIGGGVLLRSVPDFYILTTIAALHGFVAYAYYSSKACDPFEKGVISGSDEAIHRVFHMSGYLI